MLIVLEGPDGAGKTTLAGRLRDHLRRERVEPGYPEVQVEVLHRGPPTSHPLDEYEVPLWDYRRGSHRHVICDRWHLGESVYPQVLDRPSQLDEAVRWHVELFLQARGALLVPVVGDPDVLSFRIEPSQLFPDDAAENWQVKHRWEVRNRFGEAVKRSILPRYTWVGTGTADRSVAPIIEAARVAERSARSTGRFVTYIGQGVPQVLLLGDVRGGDAPSLGGPAFAPYPGTSGHYLLRSLALADPLRLGFVGVANACDVDDVRGLWWELSYPPVVALGRNATVAATRAGLAPVAELPHPQYVRRFNHRRAWEYGRAIFAAAGQVGKQPWDMRADWPERSTS